MQETQDTRVRSLSWNDPLEKEMATRSSILAWKILRTEQPDGLQFLWLQKSQTWLSTHMHAFLHKILFEHLLSNTVMGAENKQGIIPPFSEAGVNLGLKTKYTNTWLSHDKTALQEVSGEHVRRKTENRFCPHSVLSCWEKKSYSPVSGGESTHLIENYFIRLSQVTY